MLKFRISWQDVYGGGVLVLANALMALAVSAHTLRVQLNIHIVSACWRSLQG